LALEETVWLGSLSLVTGEDRRSIARKTFRCELFANSFGGIMEAGFSTFVLLLAIRVYGANDYEKALLAGSMSAGLLIAPFGLSLMRATGWTINWIACGLMAFTGFCLLLVFSSDSLPLYVTGIVLAQIALSQQFTLRAQIQTANYPSAERGRRVAWNFILLALTSMATSFGFGVFLDNRMEDHSWIFGVMAVASFLTAASLALVPAGKLSEDSNKGFLASLKLVKRDSLFGMVLLGWMLLGMGWLSTLPLRIEYLVSKEGLNLSNRDIAIVTLVIPSLAKVLSLRWFGGLFDRWNFVPFRITLNCLLIVSLLLFFYAQDFPTLCLAAIFNGLAFAGSSIAWSLWVSRIAPVGQEATYMSVHSAMTGVRGLVAPFLGYFLLVHYGFQVAAWIAVAFLALSSLCFYSIRQNNRFEHPHDSRAWKS